MTLFVNVLFGGHEPIPHQLKRAFKYGWVYEDRRDAMADLALMDEALEPGLIEVTVTWRTAAIVASAPDRD